MAEPFEAGAIQETRTAALPRLTDGAAGVDGTAAGVTAAEAAEGGPVPTEFAARTVKV